MKKLIALFLCIGFLAGVVSCSPRMDMNDYQSQNANWLKCDQALLQRGIQSKIFKESHVDCASILVPADYSKPTTSKAFKIQMMRVHRANPSKLRGSIFINPGGPGGSGIEQLQSSNFPKSLLAHYDIIGFDPRGVGHSKFSDGTEIKCDDRLDLESYFKSEGSPANLKEYKANIAISDAYLKDCAKRNPFWWTLSTQNVVDDLELMRLVVTGGQNLNFIGSSYGTTIAGMYVTRYPNHVGKIVLDSPTDVDGYSYESALESAKAMESKLKVYLSNYSKKSDITFHEAWLRLLKFKQRADDDKLIGFAGIKFDEVTWEHRISSESLLVHGIQALSYMPEEEATKEFSTAMDELQSQDWNAAFEWYALSLDGYDPESLIKDSWEPRNIVRSNSYEIMSIVNAMDFSPKTDDGEVVTSYIDVQKKVAPMWTQLNLDSNGYEYLGPDLGLSWAEIARRDPKIPDPPSESTPRFNYSHKPLLIVGSLHEAVTPFKFARTTAKQLNSPLISVESTNHAPAAGYDIPCLNKILLNYFLSDSVIRSQYCSR